MDVHLEANEASLVSQLSLADNGTRRARQEYQTARNKETLISGLHNNQITVLNAPVDFANFLEELQLDKESKTTTYRM